MDLSAPSWVFAWELLTTLAGASMCLGMSNRSALGAYQECSLASFDGFLNTFQHELVS